MIDVRGSEIAVSEQPLERPPATLLIHGVEPVGQFLLRRWVRRGVEPRDGVEQFSRPAHAAFSQRVLGRHCVGRDGLWSHLSQRSVHIDQSSALTVLHASPSLVRKENEDDHQDGH